jgi:hypothetical protein
MNIKNPAHNKWANYSNKEQCKFIKKVNLGDIATITKWGSVETGTVNLISHRGINISSPWGDKFVKWTHVLEIEKED